MHVLCETRVNSTKRKMCKPLFKTIRFITFLKELLPLHIYGYDTVLTFILNVLFQATGIKGKDFGLYRISCTIL